MMLLKVVVVGVAVVVAVVEVQVVAGVAMVVVELKAGRLAMAAVLAVVTVVVGLKAAVVVMAVAATVVAALLLLLRQLPTALLTKVMALMVGMGATLGPVRQRQRRLTRRTEWWWEAGCTPAPLCLPAPSAATSCAR